MRVLVLTQHFAPEVTAGSFRIEAFARVLARRGHEVDVICPVPNHPRGIVAHQYRGRLIQRRRRGRLGIRYLWVRASPQKTAKARIAYYGSFAAGALAAGALARRPDLVLASSPPLSVGWAGAMLASRHRCPFAFDVRDLWPQSAATLGALTNPRLLRAAERLEQGLYRKAALVVTANEAFRDHVVKRVPGAVVHTVFNGTTREWLAAGQIDSERAVVGLPGDRFVWAYAGNLGLAQPVDTAIEAAGLLGEPFRLLIVGHGPRREALRSQAARLPAGLVEFRDLVEPPEAARLLRASDALLVAERQERTVSAKLYDYCAIGRPVVAVARGELERTVRRHGIALTVPLGDPRSLAHAVSRLADDHQLAGELSDRARSFAKQHLRHHQADELAQRLELLVRTAPS